MTPDLATLREVAGAATPGRWVWNSYSQVAAAQLIATEEAFWDTADDGHTYEHKAGEICPGCGERPCFINGERSGTYWGCERWDQAYDADATVCHVPPHHGDTATGRHAADAQFIEAFDPPTVLALLDRLEAAEAVVERVKRERDRRDDACYICGDGDDGHFTICPLERYDEAAK